jgi:hypothetical protein
MKRIKIMLTSLALFAVVGGALAFKANYAQSFCTAAPGTGTNACLKACPTRIDNQAIGGSGTLVCTADFNGTCSNVQCLNQPPVRIEHE